LTEYDLVIIGGGIAGLTAGIYAAHARLTTLLLEKDVCGGLANSAVEIQNYPSYQSIGGMELMERVKEQAEKLGVEIKEIEEVIHLDLKSKTKVIETDDEQYAARAVIIATGRQPIKLQIAKDNPHIHYCAICDGTMYKNRNVLVVGGGNSGVGDALYLLDQGVSRITLVEQMDGLLASAKDQHRLYSYENVKVLTCREVVGIDTRDDEICVTLKNTKNGKTELIDVCGIFVYIGQKPQTDLFKDVLEMDPDGYLIAGDNMETNIQGIFVAGDVRQKKVRQLTTATSDGTIAALSAVEHIHSL
jgi:thioredoxin reductase (NADPH)